MGSQRPEEKETETSLSFLTSDGPVGLPFTLLGKLTCTDNQFPQQDKVSYQGQFQVWKTLQEGEV